MKCQWHKLRIVRNEPDAQIEICELCGEKKIYNKDKAGRVDNRRYLEDHIRDTAQPFGATLKIFEQIYGKGYTKILQEYAIKKKKPLKELWEEVKASDDYKADIKGRKTYA